jgi:haloalkane dehalogenase
VCVLHHREAGAPDAPAVLLLHGFPQSSRMWRDVLDPLADAGLRALAPDFAGFGDSPPDGPGTWEAQVEHLEAFRREQGIERAALVVHDWGGLIGLWWACEHPEAVSALVISSTGFFPDGRWHGFAEALRVPGQGEELASQMTADGMVALLAGLSSGIGADDAREYFRCFADEERRRSVLELYRSGDFSKLERFDGALGRLGVPTLLLWGADDDFAPVGGAHRFRKQIPDAELVVIEGARHFVVEDQPDTYATHVTDFLRRALHG